MEQEPELWTVDLQRDGEDDGQRDATGEQLGVCMSPA